jgi:predicted protein tyrosine phosphatase
MKMVVCPLVHIEAVVAEHHPSHMITLLDPEFQIETPEGLAPERHLRLAIWDICDPQEGMTPPGEAHVRELLTFGRDWSAEAPLLIHCWAGISRSTATAFMLACQRNPDVPELEIARRLRQAAPHAYPNRRLVRLADLALGRGGRMVEAVEAIGDNGFATMGRPFVLPANF